MTIDTIKFKRGVKSKLNNLSYGEPAYISDEGELYIGTESGVEKITRNKEVAELSSQLEQKANSTDVNSKVWSMANMGQDVKEAMTGGSVAVVGKDTISMRNLMYDIKHNIYDICTPNTEIVLSSNSYGYKLDEVQNSTISIRTNMDEEFDAWLTNENLFNVDEYRDYK